MATVKRTKIVNTARILREIWFAKNISRIEIARKLKLNKSTVTNIVAELLESDIVFLAEEGEPGPRGGRKPVDLVLNAKSGFVIGIEMRPEAYTVVAVDLDGEVLFSKSEKITISSKNFTESFFEIMERVKIERERNPIPLLGIGVGVSGIVDPDDKVIRRSIPLQFLDEYDFKNKIDTRLNIPVFLENDANCCAWGELVFHRKMNLLNFIFVLLEFRSVKESKHVHEITSVGMGIVIDGKVHYGKNFLSGEFRSIFRSESNKGQFSLSDEEVLLIKKDPKVLHKFFTELGKNLALLVNTFNLSQVFLGGDIEIYRREISEILENEIRANWSYPSLLEREIMFSSMGDKSVAYGAAGMVLSRLFTNTEIDNDLQRQLGKI
ncbi:MAG: ROK family transcriptional regulator [Spirochaetes bacterium]|nr:MAG: ROK family transcriptional regulator [Spirochaetota bacterium]